MKFSNMLPKGSHELSQDFMTVNLLSFGLKAEQNTYFTLLFWMLFIPPSQLLHQLAGTLGPIMSIGLSHTLESKYPSSFVSVVIRPDTTMTTVALYHLSLVMTFALWSVHRKSDIRLLCWPYMWITDGAHTQHILCAQNALNICCVTAGPIV